jgi:hypothetical protein
LRNSVSSAGRPIGLVVVLPARTMRRQDACATAGEDAGATYLRGYQFAGYLFAATYEGIEG